MKKLLLIIILTMSVQATDWCGYHIAQSEKYSDMVVLNLKNTKVRRVYLNAMLTSLIEAKYACPKELSAQIDEGIKVWSKLK